MIAAPAVPAVDAVAVVGAAAEWLRGRGVVVGPFTLRVGDTSGDAAAEMSWVGSQPPVVTVSTGLASSGDRFGLALVALHEVAHVGQHEVLLTRSLTVPWAEGMADAVAADELCPFMARVWGRGVALDSGCASGVYWVGPRPVVEYRMVSAQASGGSWRSPAARTWRLDQLRAVSKVVAP